MTLLDNLNLGCIWCKGYIPEWRRWQNLAPKESGIRPFYGYNHIGTSEQQVFGGLVKLQDLHSIFPNDSFNPNILYLISSAMPHFPVRMAQMAKKAGVKIVLNQNGVAYPGWFGKGWKRCNRPMLELHRLVDYIFYQSEFCKMSADRFVGSVCPRWEIAYNPVDTTVFNPGAKCEKNGTVKMLLAGSHGSFYRPQTAIKTLRLVADTLTDVELIIAGRFCWHRENGKAEKQVLECARAEGVAGKVRYVGPYTQKQAIELFRDADLLLHTKYNDPCPRLVVEAMSCGLPVLYSATGGTAELVGEHAGCGVPGPLDWEMDHPPSPEKLAQGALKIIDSLESYRFEARKRAVNHFDVKPWLAKHERIFLELLKER